MSLRSLPFAYGTYQLGNNFVNRKKEIERLSSNLQNGVHTILISPRRWGKSSLVNTVADELAKKKDDFIVCRMDLLGTGSRHEFYQAYTEAILKASSGTVAEFGRNVAKFLKQLIPKLSYSPGDNQEVSFSLDVEAAAESPREVLNLPERIAAEKNKRVIVFIDEFQALSRYHEPDVFQGLLRSVWQGHGHVSYCLYGSQRHLMLEFFHAYSMPFYKFGDVLLLDKIGKEEWVPFLAERFREFGRSIDEGTASILVDLVEGNSFYVQQLAQMVFISTTRRAGPPELKMGMERLLASQLLLARRIIDEASSQQLALMRAIAGGLERLSTAEALKKTGLPNSASVQKARKALMAKEILDEVEGKLVWVDPIMPYYLVPDLLAKRLAAA